MTTMMNKKNMMNKLSVVLCALLLAVGGVVGCGGGAQIFNASDARLRASRNPNDVELLEEWLFAELFASQGSLEKAQEALDELRDASAQGPTVAFGRAMLHETRGQMREAREHLLDALSKSVDWNDSRREALAEVVVAMLHDLDDATPNHLIEVEPRLRAIYEASTAGNGRLGSAAEHGIAVLLHDYRLRQGDIQGAQELAARMGCVTEVKVAGPFGPFVFSDSPLAPDADAQLGVRYDLSARRGVRATRTVRADGCSMHLGGGPIAAAGVSYVEWEVNFDAPTTRSLRLETPNGAKIWVTAEGQSRSSEALFEIDRTRESLPRVVVVPVAFPAGKSIVRLRIASRHPNPVLSAAISPHEILGNVILGRPPTGALSLRPALVRRNGNDALGRYLDLTRSLLRGDFVQARLQSQSLLAEPSPATPVRIAASIAALSETMLSSSEGIDRARTIIAGVAQDEPTAWYPVFTQLRLEVESSRDQEALQRLPDAIRRFPEVMGFDALAFDLNLRRGWLARARSNAEAMRNKFEGTCRPLRALRDEAKQEGNRTAVLEYSEALVACDARSDARLEALIETRDREAIEREAARLARFAPNQELIRLDAELTLARARNDQETANRILAQMRELFPALPRPLLLSADRLFARGQSQEAVSLIGDAINAEPTLMAGERLFVRRLGARGLIDAYRKNGPEVIAAFEANGRTYREPRVLVLDYTISQVFVDGTVLELTHNIFRVQTEEAADNAAQFQAPEDAEVLVLRTIKADGSVLEPDAIGGLSHTELPNVQTGDYVEFEYIRVKRPEPGYPTGILTDRFFFQSFETPFDHSEMVVIHDPSLPIVFDPRGRAPSAVTDTREGQRVVRYFVDESRPMVPEPSGPAPVELLPSVQWGYSVSHEDFVRAVADELVDRSVRDPIATETLRAIFGPTITGEPFAKARKIYEWVQHNIDDNDDFFGQAATMISGRTGSRARVFAYLCHAADVRAEFVIAREFGTDTSQALLPAEDLYRQILVKITQREGDIMRDIYVSCATKHADFGYLSPALRGQDGLTLSSHPEHVVVQNLNSGHDRRSSDVKIALRADGSAHFEVRETLEGLHGISWRADLESVPAAELERRFSEAYVSRLVAGAQMQSLRVVDLDAWGRPLVLEYTFDVPEFARPSSRGGFVVPSFSPTQFSSAFAAQRTRTTAELIRQDFDAAMRVEITAPSPIDAGPRNELVEGPAGMSYRLVVQPNGNTVRIERTTHIARARIEPAAYPELIRFCQRADELEAGELRY